MTKKLKQLLTEAERWPAWAQAELIDTAQELSGGLERGDYYHPSPEEIAAIEKGLDDANNGRFATDEEIQATFKKLRGA